MDIGSIMIILAAAVLVTLVIARPFYDPRQRHLQQARLNTGGDAAEGFTRSGEQARSALLAERDRVLTAIKDLEFDFSLGKLNDEDFNAQRAALLKSGAAILRQLDETGEAESGEPAPERAAPPDEPEDELEALIAARRREKEDSIRTRDSHKAAAFCHQCGKPLQKNDKFCSGCGATVS